MEALTFICNELILKNLIRIPDLMKKGNFGFGVEDLGMFGFRVEVPQER